MKSFANAEWEHLHISWLQAILQNTGQYRWLLKKSCTLQEIYTYAYSFSCERGQKCLQLEMAIAMWQLIFAQRPWPLLSLWCTFLQEHHKRAISKDTWTQLLEFVVVRLLSAIQMQCMLHIEQAYTTSCGHSDCRYQPARSRDCTEMQRSMTISQTPQEETC